MHISKYDDVTHNRKFATGYASNRSLELESFSGKSIGLAICLLLSQCETETDFLQAMGYVH